MKTDKNGQRRNTGPIPNYIMSGRKALASVLANQGTPCNFKLTHRATTVMREAMEKSVRTMGWKHSTKIAAGLPDNHPAYQISDSLHANAGVYRRPDVAINVTTKTYKQLAREGVGFA